MAIVLESIDLTTLPVRSPPVTHRPKFFLSCITRGAKPLRDGILPSGLDSELWHRMGWLRRRRVPKKKPCGPSSCPSFCVHTFCTVACIYLHASPPKHSPHWRRHIRRTCTHVHANCLLQIPRPADVTLCVRLSAQHVVMHVEGVSQPALVKRPNLCNDGLAVRDQVVGVDKSLGFYSSVGSGSKSEGRTWSRLSHTIHLIPASQLSASSWSHACFIDTSDPSQSLSGSAVSIGGDEWM